MLEVRESQANTTAQLRSRTRKLYPCVLTARPCTEYPAPFQNKEALPLADYGVRWSEYGTDRS